MKKTIVSAFICGVALLFSTSISAQGRAAVQASMFQNNMTLQDQMAKNFKEFAKANIKGSPYYDENFASATIVPLNKVFMVRYNAALDDMEVIQGKDTLILDRNNKDYIIKYSSGAKTYRILTNEADRERRVGYYTQLVKGDKISLYSRDLKKFVEEKRTTYNGNINETTMRFKDERSEYFIERANGGYVYEVPRGKKDLIAMFPEHQKEVKKFVKEYRIKGSKEKDLIKLITYINTL